MRRPEICLQFFVYNPAIVLHLIFIFVLSYSSGVGLCWGATWQGIDMISDKYVRKNGIVDFGYPFFYDIEELFMP